MKFNAYFIYGDYILVYNTDEKWGTYEHAKDMVKAWTNKDVPFTTADLLEGDPNDWSLPERYKYGCQRKGARWIEKGTYKRVNNEDIDGFLARHGYIKRGTRGHYKKRV